MNPDEARKQRTFQLELRRAVSTGILETAGFTFLLLIAVQYFEAGAMAKALVVVSSPIGLILSPLAVSLTKGMNWTAARGCAFFAWIGCAGFVAGALVDGLTGFVIGSMAGMLSISIGIPLLTQIYQENYPARERGDLFSKAVLVKVLSMTLFAWVGGWWLERDMDGYRWMMAAFAVAAATVALWVGQYPSRQLRESMSPNPLHGMRHVRDDKIFRWLLISWMFMGFGNLLMLPLRVEFLANPRYGVELSPTMIALVVSMIPSMTNLLFARFWGRLFDSMNFFVLRIVLNLCFVAAIFSFFIFGGMTGFVLGGFLFGVATAGGNVAWSLWVTKVAKPEMVAEYMGVHTFLTGVRGIAAPFLGFYLIGFIPMSTMAWGSGVSIVIACLMLLPEARSIRRRRPADPVAPKPNSIID